MQTSVTGIEQQVTHRHRCPGQTTQGGSKCRPHHSPAQREDEQPVENDIHRCGYDAAPHGEFRSAVQAHGKQGDGNPQLEQQRRGKPDQIIDNQRQQMLRRAKHTGGFFGKRQNESSDGYGYERHEKHGLGDGRTCQNGFSFRQVNGSDYGTTCPHHQSNTHEGPLSQLSPKWKLQHSGSLLTKQSSESGN